jgi:arsenate reductase-like glutaredoxin family protein
MSHKSVLWDKLRKYLDNPNEIPVVEELIKKGMSENDIIDLLKLSKKGSEELPVKEKVENDLEDSIGNENVEEQVKSILE